MQPQPLPQPSGLMRYACAAPYPVMLEFVLARLCGPWGRL